MTPLSKFAALAAGLVVLAAAAALEWYSHAAPPPIATPPAASPAAAARRPLPASTPSKSPAATASPAPPVVIASPNAPPRIIAVSISSPVVTGGEVVTGTVETSSNVASVEARIGGFSSTLAKVGVGHFVLSYRVPNLPFFLHRTYAIQVTARNTQGDSVSSSLPITVR
jgi:hypothetical protein